MYIRGHMSYYQSILEKKGIQVLEKYKTDDRERQKRSQSAFNEQGMRVCCVCKEAKEPKDYTTNNNNIDGRDARCNRCKTRLAKRYKSKVK